MERQMDPGRPLGKAPGAVAEASCHRHGAFAAARVDACPEGRRAMRLKIEIEGDSEEAVALALLQMVAQAEGKLDDDGELTGADREWVLDTYAECLNTVDGMRGVGGDDEDEDDEDDEDDDEDEDENEPPIGEPPR
jgi:hypothetical protein